MTNLLSVTEPLLAETCLAKPAFEPASSDPSFEAGSRRKPRRLKSGVVCNRWGERQGPVLFVVPPSAGKVKFWSTTFLIKRFAKTLKRLCGTLVGKELRTTYGKNFLWMIAAFYFGLKGYGNTFVSNMQLPYFRAIGVQGAQFQLAAVVARTPWSMKGLLGVLSDVVPICGYHKRSYLIIFSILGLTGFGWMLHMFAELSATSFGDNTWGLWGLAAAAFLCNTQFAGMDLLCEGKYAELMRDSGLDQDLKSPSTLLSNTGGQDVNSSMPEKILDAIDENSHTDTADSDGSGSSAVIALVWGCVQSGTLMAALLLGVILRGGDAGSVGSQLEVLGLYPLPFVLLVLVFVCRGFLPEKRVCTEFGTVRVAKFRATPRLYFLAIAMAIGALLVAVSAMASTSNSLQVIVTLGTSGILICLAFYALPRRLALANLYLFIMSSSYLDLSGSLSYFYTGGSQCIVDGPQFSYGYYLSVSNAVGAIFGVLGTVVFQNCMSNWTYRRVFQVTTLLQITAALSDLVIVLRWNRRYLGLTDAVTYLFGDAAVQPLAAMLVMMPQGLLTSRLCPKGSEATVFAILAGFQNFGQNVASILGVVLTQSLGVQASTSSCDFINLAPAIVAGHCILPLLNIPLTCLLIPSNSMEEPLEEDIDEEVVEDAAYS